MKISEFSDICESLVPEGLAYRAQGRYAYNTNKTVEPVLLFVPPRRWTMNVRGFCEHREEVEFWIGIPADLKQSGKQQWANYSPINARELLIDLASEFITALSINEFVRVVENGLIEATFYDAPEGFAANNLTWLTWSLTVELQESPYTVLTTPEGDALMTPEGEYLTI